MEKRRQGNFQRTKAFAYVKLSRRSKARYKRPTGRHNKSRQKWRSRPPMVEIGYKNKKTTRALVNGKAPVLVCNLADLKKVGKDNIAILAKIGRKLKIEIAKEALASKINVFNLNIGKFLKNIEKESAKKAKKPEDKNKSEKKPENKEDAKKQQ